MSKIPQVGFNLIASLSALFIVTLGLRIVSDFLDARQQMPFMPAEIAKFTPVHGEIPDGDLQRDAPKQENRIYSVSGHLPINVCIAKATNFNSFRVPESYILDVDGHVLSQSRIEVQFPGDPLPHYLVEYAQGHDSTILLVHWYQYAGTPARTRVRNMYREVVKGLLFHKPLYVCDAWIRVTGSTNSTTARKELIMFANQFENLLKNGYSAG